MTHQELLNDWVRARFCVEHEFSGDISNGIATICREAIEYARDNGLDAPAQVVDEIDNREGWDEPQDRWTELKRLVR